ncbi:MAG: DUF1836 domain-containing protein [Clostridia bacterium]|nr:DUF1836 domain-containing protein [Clostridia bacterium]
MDNMSAATDAISKLSEFRMPRHHELPDIDCYMDQVISIMEKHLDILSSGGSKFITPAMINNYVKLGLIPPPIKKRYTREHLCYLYIICSLKSVIAIPAISELIGVLTRSRPILEVYDLFCEAYENMLRRAAETAQEMLSETGDPEEGLSKLSLFMAVNAATTQLIATGTLSGIAEDEEPEAEPQ